MKQEHGGGGLTTGTSSHPKVERVEMFFEDHILNLATFHHTMFPWIRIDELKKQLVSNYYHKKISWKDIRFFYKNIQLTKNNKGLFEYNIEFGSTIVIMAHTLTNDQELGIINPYEIFKETPQEIKILLVKVQSGLTHGHIPKLAEEGTSGSYFLESADKKRVAIFKPYDQQPYAPLNPRNYVGQLGDCGIRKGILSGQCATREVAAYLLDDAKFHGVPPTTYVEFYHPNFRHIQKQQPQPILSQKENKIQLMKAKHGSLQEFVQSHDNAGNLSAKMFDVEEVHKIAILDIRILNCDRNEANILVKKMVILQKDTKGVKSKFLKLIPIDHGLSFIDNFEIYDYQMVWMGYPQVQKPFSKRSLDYIAKINPTQDSKKLREKLGFRQICLRNFRIAETFLKKMAAAGFSLYEIGSLMYRNDEQNSDEQENNENSEKSIKQFKEKSQLERLVIQAQNIYFLVKENGIKSTIQLQIRINKHKKGEVLSPIYQDEEPKQNKNPHKKVTFNDPSIEKKTVAQTNKYEKKIDQRSRNVSLPNLKKQSSTSRQTKLKKRRERQGPNGIHKVGRINEQWQQIFFHYFQDLLDRFILQKLKNAKKTRNRLMSENLDDD